MEKTIIYYKPEVETFINNLVFDLYIKDYFGFLEDAIKYKDSLIDFIEKHISNFPHRFTPFALRNLGSKYIFYQANHNTTRYVFLRTKTMNS